MAPVSGVDNAEKRIRGINIHRTTRSALAVWRHRCLRSHLRLLFSPAFACPVGLSPGGQDVGVAPKTIQQRDGPLLVAKYLYPLAEGEVGGQESRTCLVALGELVEEKLSERNKAELVVDQEVHTPQAAAPQRVRPSVTIGIEVV